MHTVGCHYLSICTLRLIASNSTEFLLLACLTFLDLFGKKEKSIIYSCLEDITCAFVSIASIASASLDLTIRSSER